MKNVLNNKKSPNNKSGFAAIISLWMVVLVVAILGAYAYNLMEEAKLSDAMKRDVETEQYANAAVNKALAYIMQDRGDKPQATDLLINEVRLNSDTVADNKYIEYIEIYNPTDGIIDLSTYSISIRMLSAAASADSFYQRNITSWEAVTAQQKIHRICDKVLLDPGAYAIILPHPYKTRTDYDDIIPSNALLLALSGDGASDYLCGTPNGMAGPSLDWRAVITLIGPSSNVSTVDLGGIPGQIHPVTSYERVNFNLLDAASAWEICDGLPPIIYGTPGSLNATVKFSESVALLPYIGSYKDWWEYSEDIDGDGNPEFRWSIRPSTSKFNVNHHLISGAAAVCDHGRQVINEHLHYYFQPSGDIRTGINTLYCTMTTTAVFAEEFGASPRPSSAGTDCYDYKGYYKTPDDLMAVTWIGLTTYSNMEKALTIYPTYINNYKIFPYNINHASETTVYSHAFTITMRPSGYAGSPTTASGTTRAGYLLTDIYTDRIKNNTNLFDGAGLGNSKGALQEYIDYINSLGETRFYASTGAHAQWLKQQFIIDAIAGINGIPLVFGQTYALGKYIYWEMNIESYSNWRDGEPMTVKRVRAEVAVPVYNNQPAPDDKPKIVYWTEDWPTLKWRITDY